MLNHTTYFPMKFDEYTCNIFLARVTSRFFAGKQDRIKYIKS